MSCLIPLTISFGTLISPWLTSSNTFTFIDLNLLGNSLGLSSWSSLLPFHVLLPYSNFFIDASALELWTFLALALSFNQYDATAVIIESNNTYVEMVDAHDIDERDSCTSIQKIHLQKKTFCISTTQSILTHQWTIQQFPIKGSDCSTYYDNGIAHKQRDCTDVDWICYIDFFWGLSACNICKSALGIMLSVWLCAESTNCKTSLNEFCRYC